MFVYITIFRTNDCCRIPSLFEIPPPQPLPQPPYLMPLSHRIIDILSSLANDGAALGAAVRGACPSHRPAI